MDNSNRSTETLNGATEREVSEQDVAMMDVLNMNMMDVKYIHGAFHDLCSYLSIYNTLQEFCMECGLSLQEYALCDSMVRSQPYKLPAQTVLEIYFTSTRVTLRDFMRVLLKMEKRHHKIRDLTLTLWNAALFGNSEYFRNSLRNSESQ